MCSPRARHGLETVPFGKPSLLLPDYSLKPPCPRFPALHRRFPCTPLSCPLPFPSPNFPHTIKRPSPPITHLGSESRSFFVLIVTSFHCPHHVPYRFFPRCFVLIHGPMMFFSFPSLCPLREVADWVFLSLSFYTPCSFFFPCSI